MTFGARRAASWLALRCGPTMPSACLMSEFGGVEGTYDRHSYVDEKRDALERLARLLRQIIDGEPAKVVQFPARSAAE